LVPHNLEHKVLKPEQHMMDLSEHTLAHTPPEPRSWEPLRHRQDEQCSISSLERHMMASPNSATSICTGQVLED
ncbi:MAG: hypothetical protein O3B86_08255, partial [Planctomycetota bacterium]|nr:hypothetical protein [Planctomycetota bacterium]